MNRICAALDVSDPAAAARLAERLVGHVGLFKVGLELFVAHGRAAVDAVRKLGQPIFLDLKLHDIPQTVESAARGVAALGVDYLTVHASGGAEMIRAARRALPRTKLLAVTALTSLALEDLDAVGLARARSPPGELAMEAGRTGGVCSPQEVTALRHVSRRIGAPGGPRDPSRRRGEGDQRDRNARRGGPRARPS